MSEPDRPIQPALPSVMLHCVVFLTGLTSRFAILSSGIRRVTKKIDSMRKPFAARVWNTSSVCARPCFSSLSVPQSYNYTVIPSEYGKLIQARDQVPARSDVSREEYAKGEDGDRVHEVVLSCSKCRFAGRWW